MSRVFALGVSLMLFATASSPPHRHMPSAPVGLVGARNAAVDHVQANYSVGPDLVAPWHEDRVAEQDATGWVVYQYTSVPWIVTVGGPAAGLDADYYDVVILNPEMRFSWEGRVVSGSRVVEGSESVLAACDAACDYLAGQFPELGIGDLEWIGRRVTPDGLVGRETYPYTAGDWMLTVVYPVVAPDAVAYQIMLENEANGFVWEGEMDAGRHLTQTAAYSRVPETESSAGRNGSRPAT